MPFQTVGKCETIFNLRLNTHRTHAKCDNSILVGKHLKSAGHDFTKHARVTIIEKLEITNMSKGLITKTLERREDFWMIKLDTNTIWFQHFPQQPHPNNAWISYNSFN